MKASLEMRRPDDMHVHLRDGAMLADTTKATASCFSRAIVMPNLVPPVTTAAKLTEYRSAITNIAPEFTPLMTVYLTEKTLPADLDGATAVKWYPAGATTNSALGVQNIENCFGILKEMAARNMVLCVHGEVVEEAVDIFDREAKFLQTLARVRKAIPELKIVLEHITTSDAADFVITHDNIAATITPQHLLITRNDILVGGIKPHHYCLPVAKRAHHREALVHAATSGNPKFFLGTDSAPHAQSKKESACGCAGCYTAPIALSLYAKVFDEAGKLERLEDFASTFGAQFYGLALNADTITLIKQPFVVPDVVMLGSEPVIPFWAGKTLDWQVKT